MHRSSYTHFAGHGAEADVGTFTAVVCVWRLDVCVYKVLKLRGLFFFRPSLMSCVSVHRCVFLEPPAIIEFSIPPDSGIR